MFPNTYLVSQWTKLYCGRKSFTWNYRLFSKYFYLKIYIYIKNNYNYKILTKYQHGPLSKGI
jgi:hypothetical protein